MTTFNDVVRGAKKAEEKEERDLTKERELRCEPIAQEIMKMIGNFEGPINTVDRMEYVKAHDPLIASIADLLQQKELPVAEWGYVMSLAQIRFDHTKNWVAETIATNMDQVLDNFWGKPTGEVTFSDIAIQKRSMIQLN